MFTQFDLDEQMSTFFSHTPCSRQRPNTIILQISQRNNLIHEQHNQMKRFQPEMLILEN